MASDTEILRRMEKRVHELRLEEKARKIARRANPEPLQFRYPRHGVNSVGRRFDWLEIKVPDHLSFSFSKRNATCVFFCEIESAVRRGSRVSLIFAETKVIAIDALTYLLALIQKIRWYHGQNAITGTYPASRKVERLLTDSGFYKILGVKSRIKFKPSSIRYVKYRSDTKLLGEHIEILRQDLLGDDFQLDKVIARKLVRAIKEAMSNVSHHAYANKSLRSKKMLGRWWLTACLNLSKNQISFSFYDCGVGIPKTLIRQYGIEHVRALISLLPAIEPDDSEMIKAAVQLGRTGTQQQNRGKGLQDMHQLINKVEGGSLTIHSRHGSYLYNFADTKTQNFSEFLEGTLITWILPLDKVIENIDALLEHDGVDDE